MSQAAEYAPAEPEQQAPRQGRTRLLVVPIGIVLLLLGFSIVPLFLHYSALPKAGDCIVLMFATLIVACGWAAQWTLQIAAGLDVGTASIDTTASLKDGCAQDAATPISGEPH